MINLSCLMLKKIILNQILFNIYVKKNRLNFINSRIKLF